MLHYFTTLLKAKLNNDKGELGMSTVMGLSMTIIVSAFIILPGLKEFGVNVTDGMGTWWTSISGAIFPASV